MSERLRIFGLPEDTDLEALLAGVRDRFRIEQTGPLPVTRQYFDTFDWRLHEAGTALFFEVTPQGRTLRWERLSDRAPLYTLSVKAPPRMARDLPPGAFREALAAVTDPRALMPVVEVRLQEHRVSVLDRERKTTARLLVCVAGEARNPGARNGCVFPGCVYVAPVKGYRKASRKLEAFLRDVAALPEAAGHEFTRALAAIGRTPGDNFAKLNFRLDPKERADRAIRPVLLHLLDTMRHNEPGLRENIDTEFVHDYRVAVRRTRSILGQLRRIFPPEPLAHFRTEFKWLGEITGPVRDLDVYLLRMDEYRAHLPESVRDDLAPLGVFLEKRQRQAHAAMIAAMDTPRYRALLQEWRAFLEAPLPDEPPTPYAGRPLRDVVSERIRKTHRNVLREGRAIGPETPAEALHEMRITCKKLRYLLEIFRSLYPEKLMRRLIPAVKSLQTVLGDHQDFAVQQEALQNFARQMAAEGVAPVETLTAMGRLEAYLAERQLQARAAFTESFARFASPKNRARFEKLFKPGA
jgi:CHAD domain-containing protein